MTKPLSPQLAGLPLAPAENVYDNEQNEFLEKSIRDFSRVAVLEDPKILDKYKDTYVNWISSTQNNKVSGLDLFEEIDFCQATSEAFDKFYIENYNRKFKCFRGEYLYHQISWKGAGRDWGYIDEVHNTANLEENDAIVFSFPFSDTGNKHPLVTKEFLDRCLELKIPVMIDCAYFGICQNLDFDFTHPAIRDVAFSLSKSFPVRHLRIGLRMSKTEKGDGLTAYNNTQYLNKLSCKIGIDFMERYSPDHPVNTYKDVQQKFCQKFDLTPSSTVIFGIDEKSKYPKYNRGYYNSSRICFSKYLKIGNIPPEII